MNGSSAAAVVSSRIPKSAGPVLSATPRRASSLYRHATAGHDPIGEDPVLAARPPISHNCTRNAAAVVQQRGDLLPLADVHSGLAQVRRVCLPERADPVRTRVDQRVALESQAAVTGGEQR